MASAADRELDAILRFWLRNAPDPAGGFWAEWRGRPERKGIRGALLTSRILWTFSAAYHRTPDPAFLRMATHAYIDLQRFRDLKHGGLVWSIDPQNPRPDAAKEIYGQAFGILGLSEFFRATGDRAALDDAIALYRLIEAHGRDREEGGYFSTIAPDWNGPVFNRDPGPKSQNTTLHILEAYTNLLTAWDDPGLRRDLVALIGLFNTHFINQATHHLHLFLSADLMPMTTGFSPGHDIELSWLLTKAAQVIGDASLAEQCRRLALSIASATLPTIESDGGMPYEVRPGQGGDLHRAWWVMAEATVGFLGAFELSGNAAFLTAAETCWLYIQRHIIDRRQGEWIARVSPDGRPDRRAAKIGFWKCPYHNARACMEIADRTRRLVLA